MKLKKEFVFDFFGAPECHASTVVRLSTGRLVVAWFGGTKEKANDVRIWVSFKDGETWSTPIPVTPDDGIPHWNPVLYADGSDRITLYYKIGYEIKDWKTYVTVSKDGGESWSKSTELIPGDESGGRGPVKNKILRTCSGRLIAPASTEIGIWQPLVDISDDGGITWEKKIIPISEKTDAIQPTLWESESGKIHALMRTNQGKIYRSFSENNGESWCTAYATDMPNNNSGIDAVMNENGTVYLVCNPVPKNWGARSPLTVFSSEDNGVTFTKLAELETEAGEFSYPAVISVKNRLYITYTWNRRKIAFTEIEL